ncbi:polysaccharide biosynthesis protein [Aquimarina sp. ERC-38]|uniref:lipopolysaccharide biosynthesis protein n=1 Tax=Aquimarina sp. ERC-38 TaxID=2949996 RepID=UPI0022462D2B|nr:polysaccharide biosynthesis protein [Aquimarina sp. ERC-38]UZO81463.1 polysaccharide biosynthesis protein [Aquimarina sp. ERC-38]
MFIKSLKNNKELPKLISVVLDQACMSITTLSTTVVLARTYSKENYADIVLLFTIALFILGLQSAVIVKPFAISRNDTKHDPNSVRKSFIFTLNIKFLFTFILLIVFPVLYTFSFENWDSTQFLLFLLYIFSHSSYFFIREIMLSQRKTVQNLKYGLLCATGIITFLAFIYFNQITNFTIFLSTASGIYLLLTVSYFIANYKGELITKKEYYQLWEGNWRIGKWLLGSNFLFHVSTNIYPWLLLYITSKNDIAILGVLMSIAGLVNPLLTALSSYLLPIFVDINKDYKKIKNAVAKWMLLFGSLAALLVIFGCFSGQFLIATLFGNKYENLGWLVVLPFVVQSINIFFQPFKIALNAIKRTDINFWVLIPRSVIAISLGYIMITKFGLYGVFYTMIVENLVYQLIHFGIYRNIIGKDHHLQHFKV